MRDISVACNLIRAMLHVGVDVYRPDSERVLSIAAVKWPEYLQSYFSGPFKEALEKTRQIERNEYYLFTDEILNLVMISTGLWENDCLEAIVFIGPFKENPVTIREVNYLSSKLRLPLDHRLQLEQFLNTVRPPVAPFPYIGQFVVNLLNQPLMTASLAVSSVLGEPILDEIDYVSAQKAVENVEIQYGFEASLLDGVRRGDVEDTFEAYKKMPTNFQYRNPGNPLRLNKNLSIVFATLLRVAAREGGLPPLIVHSMSERYSFMIENALSRKELLDLETTMIEDYCQAVTEYQLSPYSPAIKTAITYMRKNYAESQILDKIAALIPMQKAYLSRKFKKETHRTITEYLNHIRINQAQRLMIEEKMPITEVGLAVGFESYNYFSTVFKKTTGMSCSSWVRAHAT